MLQNSKKKGKKGMILSSGYLQKEKGQNMLNKNRRNTIVKSECSYRQVNELNLGLVI